MKRLSEFFKNKTVQLVLIGFAALILFFSVKSVFAKETTSVAAGDLTEEGRISALLSKIEGVGNAEIAITKEDGVAVSAVVVFDGADAIMTRVRVQDTVSALLRIEKTAVIVLPACN